MKRATLIIAALLLSAPVPSYAGDDETSAPKVAPAHSWKQSNLALRWGRGFSKEAQETRSKGEFIYTDGPNGAGTTAIMCFDGKLQALIAMNDDPINESIRSAWNAQRTRSVRPTFKINDEPQTGSYWAYQPKLKLAIPRRPKLTKQIYNGAIRGDVMDLDMDAKDNVRLVLPKPNAAFADFGAACNVGRKKKLSKKAE